MEEASLSSSRIFCYGKELLAEINIMHTEVVDFHFGARFLCCQGLEILVVHGFHIQ